jgi:glutamine---fructose-6-phosphate transaminase (isomerizing)
MSVLLTEIHEQPAAIARALSSSKSAIADLVAEARRREVQYVILAARGTSDNAATYAQYLFQIACGLPAGLATPSVHTLYEASVSYKNALVIGVSQSGAGEDIIEVIAQAKKSGALTAAITNTEDSKLALAADHLLLCDAGTEKAVAATKTYTTTLAIFAALIAAWSGSAALNKHLAALPENASKALQTLDSSGRVLELARTLIHAPQLLTIARGLHLPTAIEAALKIAETSYTTTRAFSSADLLHGPIAMIGAQTPCLCFLPGGKTKPMMETVVATLKARGARVLTLSESADADLPIISSGTELLAPILDILPAQLLAYHLTVARGYDPDNPRGLSKVTVTY